MSTFQLKHLIAGAAMLATAAGAVVLKPTVRMAEQRPINLERMIPQQFGDWKLDQSIAPVQVDPEVQAKLDKIYSQVLSRTYINGKGERVMLSIAYGADQSDGMRVHRPDVCYPAQGFNIQSVNQSVWLIANRQIAVRNIDTSRAGMEEFVSYWVIVGTIPAISGFSQKIGQLQYGLKGVVPDGLIFRVSVRNGSREGADLAKRSFTQSLWLALDGAAKNKIFGI